MKTIIDLDIDPELLTKAKNLSGIEDDDALAEEALRALIARESARRAVMLGTDEPGSGTPPRGAGATD